MGFMLEFAWRVLRNGMRFSVEIGVVQGMDTIYWDHRGTLSHIKI
jgi:hypothetical protein